MSKSAHGALIARRTPKTRDGVEFTQNTQISQDPVYKQGAIHTIAISIYPQCKHFPQRMCASPATTGIDPQVPCYWISSKIRLAARKNSMCHPPHVDISAYTPGLCVPRCNWPLGAVFTGPEGALKARRTSGKRNGVEFTQTPKYHKIQITHRV